MALEAADLAEIGKLIAAAVAPIAANMAPEKLALAVTPVIEAQIKAAGLASKADLDKRDADAKTAADKAAADKLAADKAAEDAKGKPGKKDEPAADPRIAELEKRLADLSAENATGKAAASAAAEKARAERLVSNAKDALAKAGIPADRIEAALALVEKRGVLAYDGDRAGWKGKDPKLNVDAVLDLEAAAKAWVEGEGKFYLPPVAVGGTGEGAGQRGTGGPPATGLRDASGKLDTDKALNRLLSS